MKLTLFHQVSGILNFTKYNAWNKTKYYKKIFDSFFQHILPFTAILIVFLTINKSYSIELPEPLKKSDFHYSDPKKAKLGSLLFYDKILSGNQNISCGTCHHHDFGSSDGLSLGIGEGGNGVGPERNAGIGINRIKKRVPRNSSSLWNLGAKEVSTLLHDGSISISNIYGNKFNTPAEEWLPEDLDNILAVQALFPMTKQFEMAGNFGENEIIGLSHRKIDTAWPAITNRIRSNQKYVELFKYAYDDINDFRDIKISHIVNAIAAFVVSEWASYDTPFDDYLNGNENALSKKQIEGMELFYGKANCSSCHSGSLFTDQKFYSIALPQFGPGRTRRFDPYTRDVGRMGESDDINDMYKFKTPSLRNISLTAPYGHNGAYPTLKGIIKHHLNPKTMHESWTPDKANLTPAKWLEAIDFVVFKDKREQKRLLSRIDIEKVELTDLEIDKIIEFLNALTDRNGNNRPIGRPENVPSGLSVD